MSLSGKDIAMEDNNIMTDRQFTKILQMVKMILDGCEDLDEAKRKIEELAKDEKTE